MPPRILLLSVGLAFALAGSGCTEQLTVLDLPEVAACSASSCPNGCCDASGVCRPGDSELACGGGGALCRRCNVGSTCEQGVCLPAQQTGGGGPDGPDAGRGSRDGGTGPDEELEIDGGRRVDAGVCLEPEPLPPCSATNCDGCCSGGVCLTGQYAYACGSGGEECTLCKLGASCSGGMCVATISAPDLTVEDVRVMDVWHPPGRLSFTITGVVSNIGDADMPGVLWSGVYSTDTQLNLGTDRILLEKSFESLSRNSRRTVSERAVYDYTYVGNPPGPTAFVIILADSTGAVTEASLLNNERASVAFSTSPADCGPGNCTGCCTQYGCLGREDQGAPICGRNGESCTACDVGLVCNDGRCE